ncbi:MAG: hypothetical protein LBC96_05755 [Lachnospiraceae bacterium]|jgi:hypothetical protein|nr:hypothetical protein [Lachnospiraceae bacterium]
MSDDNILIEEDESEKGQWSVADDIRAEQKAALSKMSLKGKILHLWEYYKIQAIITVAVTAILIGLISSIAGKRPLIFHAILINSYIMNDELITNDFIEFAALDTSSHDCFIDTSTVLTAGDMGQYSIATTQRIMAVIMVGDLDVIVSDEYHFLSCAESEFFADLRTILDEDVLASLAGNIFYIDQAVIEARNNAEPDFSAIAKEIAMTEAQIAEMLAEYRKPELMERPMPVGIIIHDSPVFEQMNGYLVGVPVFGFIANSVRKETAMLFWDYLRE